MGNDDKERDMKTIALSSFRGDWRAIVSEMRHSGEAIELELDGALCGFILPAFEAAALARHFARPKSEAPREAIPPDMARNYLELLRDDPTLVPVVDGQLLEFVTMMNSSYVDPQQIYQFRHPTTRQLYLYRASELQQAIGRAFARVEFIPQRPRDFVDGKPEQTLR
jgi:hypothetical protein